MTAWTFHRGGLLVGVFSPLDKPESVDESHTSLKIAAFDLDGTIIKTKSGKIYPQNSDDWEWWDPIVPLKIQKAYDQGFVIKIITNQGRLTDLDGNEAPEAEIFKRMIQQILDILDVPLSIYVACANDNWRKPRTGIWELLVREYQQKEKQIDHSNSFLVGDAAGRASDHTDADIHYSINLGIGFYTPEEFFLDIPGKTTGHKFDPSLFLEDQSSWTDFSFRMDDRTKRIIVLVGGPGAGKSYFFKKILHPLGYYHISLHNFRSQKICEEEFENALKEGKPVAIDNINSTVESRRVWLSIARKYNTEATAIFFNLPLNLCLHNDTVRALGADMMNPEGRGIFPRTPFLKLMDEFEKPLPSEGFAEVINLGFQWMGNDSELQIWRKYWV